jgi:diketogulonate reductase-like aldo/keto reductase
MYRRIPGIKNMEEHNMEQTYITLNNGAQIPQFGLGVFQIAGNSAAKQACLDALKSGYRHIDTAHAYQNERGVGAAVKESGIPRKEIGITSKLWPSEYGEGKTMEGIDKMLTRLGTDCIDLLLLHQQFGDYLGAWRDMEKAVAQGKVRSIGLSNFESERLEEVLAAAKIKPAVLQVECHPYYQQKSLKARIAPYGTAIECWYPIGHGDKGLISEPIFTELGQKYGRSNVQIILRWHIQEGNIIFPKSTNPAHIKANFDIFDFALTDEEMNRIRELDKGIRYFNMSLSEQEEHLGQFILED